MKHARLTKRAYFPNERVDEIIENAENECLSYQDIIDAQDILEMLKRNGLQDSPVYFDIANAVFGLDPLAAEGSVKSSKKAMRKRAYKSFDELTIEEKQELAEAYLCQLADEGVYREVMNVDWDAPSWGELASALTLVPEDVLEREYGGTLFTEEDFWCNLTASKKRAMRKRGFNDDLLEMVNDIIDTVIFQYQSDLDAYNTAINTHRGKEAQEALWLIEDEMVSAAEKAMYDAAYDRKDDFIELMHDIADEENGDVYAARVRNARRSHRARR